MQSTPLERGAADAPAPARGAKPPVWTLVLIGALAAPWLYLGAQRVHRYVDLELPRDGVEACTLPTPTRASFTDRGFVEMVPPLRLPSRLDGSEQIEVWIKLPTHGDIGVTWLGAPRRPALTYPPGTIADRIELLDGVHIVDVRGTELGLNGAEMFHVFQPRDGELHGFVWPRDDARAQDEATRRLLAVSTAKPRETEVLRINNACGPCHEHARSERLGSVPARATDAVGWFVPATVLVDRAPVERHRPREMNVDDPYIHFVCPRDGGDDAATMVTHGDGTRWPSCGRDLVAIGVLDVPAALAAGDDRVRRLCASREALFARMNGEARAAFTNAFDACGFR